MPPSFMPPNTAISQWIWRDDALVDADDAVFEGLGDAPDAGDVAAVEIGSRRLSIIADPAADPGPGAT
jgi:hypothetical protein